jgi:hypothetical protein
MLPALIERRMAHRARRHQRRRADHIRPVLESLGDRILPSGIDLFWSGNLGAPAAASVRAPFAVTRTYGISGAPAPSDFTIAYYASPDATFGDAGDVLLGTETITATADKTIGSHAGSSPLLQFSRPGSFYLFAQLNSTNTIVETDATNDTNNVAGAACPVAVTSVVVVANGAPGYTETGTWTDAAGGYGGTSRESSLSSGPSTATWDMTGVAPGTYAVQATWTAAGDQATSAPYFIFDGDRFLETVRANQQEVPWGTRVGGATFQTLTVVTVTSGRLRVVLSNDVDGGVIANAVRAVSFGPDIIGAGAPGYTETETWADSSSGGYGGTSRWSSSENGDRTAAWERTGLVPGTYAVQVTWTAAGDRATNAPYLIYDGDRFLERIRVNQQEGPVGTAVGGAVFQPLEAFTITSGTLRVVLTNDANGSVSADAVRLVRLDDIPAVAPPLAPALYSLPSGALRVTTAAELVAALQGATRDIVLAAGVYDNSGPFFDYGAHHLYAEHLGGAVLRAGLVIGSNQGPGGGLVRGLVFDISDPAKAFGGGSLHLWGAGGADAQVLDCVFRGNKVIPYGLLAYSPGGLVAERLQFDDFTDEGIRASDNITVPYGAATPRIETISDIDVNGVTRAVPESSNGTAEAGLFIGQPALNGVRRIKVRNVSLSGIEVANNSWDTTFRDLDIDMSGPNQAGGVGIYLEHFSYHDVFDDFWLTGVRTGIHAEWNDPAWGGVAGAHFTTIENGVIDAAGSTLPGNQAGIYLDAGTEATVIQGVVFRNQN